MIHHLLVQRFLLRQITNVLESLSFLSGVMSAR